MVVTTVKTTNLAREIESALDQFFDTATDEQFWKALEDAGWSVFSNIDVPIIDYHSKATRYLITAKQMSTPQRVPELPRTVRNRSTWVNSNELALAA